MQITSNSLALTRECGADVVVGARAGKERSRKRYRGLQDVGGWMLQSLLVMQ